MRSNPVRLLCAVLLASLVAGTAAADPPDWAFDPAGWSDFMAVTGRLDLDGSAAATPGTLIGAFVEGELRGAAEVDLRFVETLGPLFFLQVWSNGAPDELVTFQAYDPAADAVLLIGEALTYDANATPGTPEAPFVWSAGSVGTPPMWDFDPGAFEFFMGVTGAVFIGGDPITPVSGHRVAAFVGDELRGVAEVDLGAVDPFGPLFFLQVWADQSSGETIRFEVWDAVGDVVLDLTETVAFAHQTTLGTVPDPFVWTTGGGPFAFDDATTTYEDEAATIYVLANDPGGSDLTVAAVSAPANGTATIGADDGVTYTPAPDFFGADSFTYTVSDGAGGTATAVVNVTVTPVNDAPEFVSEPVTSVALNVAYVYDVVVGDVDDETLAVTGSDLPVWLSLTDGGDGTATLAGSPPTEGDYAVILVASDGDLTAEQPFIVTVTGPNATPVLLDDEAETDEDTAVLIDVIENDSDPDGDMLTVTDVSAPGNGTAASSDDGAITYTPAADFYGPDSFTYTASDGNGSEATATVTVTVLPVNDAPTAATITNPEDGAMILLAGDPQTAVDVGWTPSVDVEGDAISYRWEAVLAGGDFSTPLLTIETDATSFETTYGVLDAALVESGVGAGESAVVEHRVVSSDEELETLGPAASVTLTRGVLTDSEASPLPTSFAVGGAYPNPSTGPLAIAVDLPWAAAVTIEVYDIAGRWVTTIQEQRAGGHGQNVSMDGIALPSGVYVYRLIATARAESETASGRFTVVR